LKEAIDLDAPAATGGFPDTLKSFGLAEDDPLIQHGVEFAMSRQNPDGSWGEPKAADSHTRCHPTWAAINELRDYLWRGEGVTSAEALRRPRGRRTSSVAR